MGILIITYKKNDNHRKSPCETPRLVNRVFKCNIDCVFFFFWVFFTYENFFFKSEHIYIGRPIELNTNTLQKALSSPYGSKINLNDHGTYFYPYTVITEIPQITNCNL